MWSLFWFLGMSAQLPAQMAPSMNSSRNTVDFALQEGPDVFSPKDLITLGRPGTAVANDAGDLALVLFSNYSLEEKKNKKSVYIVPLESDVKPFEFPLEKEGETFWLNTRTFAHVVEGDDNNMEIYAVDVSFTPALEGSAGALKTHAPQVIGTLPSTTAMNFRYNGNSRHLVFSDNVYADGNVSSIREQDEAWEARGNTAYVYDKTYVRHWDTWAGNKSPQLFSVLLYLNPDGKWEMGAEINSPLKGTGHHCPVEPSGGTDDFDVSSTHVVYTTKDPNLPEAWHTKQNIYIVDIEGQEKPRELTSGKQGAVHNPVFNTQGSKLAWLQLDQDGYESDRAKIVIYDLTKRVRFTLTQNWDRSPDTLAFSKEDNFLYFTAGDEAKVKIFVLPVPHIPQESTTHPQLDSKYTIPMAITNSHAASGIQTLFTGRLLFTQSSFTSPNDVFVVNNLKRYEAAVLQGEQSPLNHVSVQQVTRFTEPVLKHKNLSESEEFWFEGARGKTVQGWALKPRGWKAGEEKKWPVVLLIHGGPQGAWEDVWSNRWNPNVFAQQGYFVIMINPTGSTTFGQEFTDAIAENWGGRPFVDLIKGWKYALHKYPEIDSDRAVAAGASWGGYAINWIQGHPEFGFGFKALVCHDGVFDSAYNGYSTDELFFFNHEWGGRPWESKSKELAEKYSPLNFVDKWSTPQLLIHGSKDFRLPETESIAAFQALQQLGIPSRLVIFPDENHWVLNPGNSLKWHYEVFRWFDTFVGQKE